MPAPKYRYKKGEKPNIKQQQFAEKLLEPGMTQTQAYMAVYDQKDPALASSSASQLAHHPKVQAHIRQVLDRTHPDRAETAGNAIMNIITDPESSATEKLNAIKVLVSIEGWQAPTRTENLSAKVDLSQKYKLPGSDK